MNTLSDSAKHAPAPGQIATSPPPAPTHWPAIASLFCAGLAAAMQFSKLSPVMQDVAQSFAFGPLPAGLAVSSLGIVGVIFAIAMGALIGAFGAKRALLLALITAALLALLGAAAPEGVTFLATRIAEGFAHLTIVISAPALMAAAANEGHRPLAMALWGCFFGLAFALVSLVAPLTVTHFGWRGLMVLHAAFTGLVGLANWRALTWYHDQTKPLPGWRGILATHRAVYSSGAPLLIALTFCAYTLLFLAVLTFLGRFLGEVHGWSFEAASAFMAALAIVTLVTTLLSGLLVRAGVPMLAGFALAFITLMSSAVLIFVIGVGGTALSLSSGAMMAAFGLVPGFVFANVPRIAPRATRAALTYGAIAQFGNVGTFAGTPLLALCLAHLGWRGCGIGIALIAGTGLIIAARLQHLARQSPEE